VEYAKVYAAARTARGLPAIAEAAPAQETKSLLQHLIKLVEARERRLLRQALEDKEHG